MRIPRLYAAASLKPSPRCDGRDCSAAYSAALCRGLIEASGRWVRAARSTRYSAALCRGLIEAPDEAVDLAVELKGIPRLYAAASLKPHSGDRASGVPGEYSAALCRGLIEAPRRSRWPRACSRYSAALCRGLIEASERSICQRSIYRYSAALCRGLIEAARGAALVPERREYSAALCRGLIEAESVRACQPPRQMYSAALCRGLIEARGVRRRAFQYFARIPRLYAAASLKRHGPDAPRGSADDVFRGFMPRPH